MYLAVHDHKPESTCLNLRVSVIRQTRI
jgi:hypothetical protein